jgi:biotin carboxylase
MQKRILILGGADIQISAIKKAKELGYYVITCDYLPDNPGHKFSDEYHNVSTTDKEKVLELASKLKIDGISAYASDPAALTAAYVSEKLNLSGNSFQSISILSDKYHFRKIQQELNLPHPHYYLINSVDDIYQILESTKLNYILKPADTSGSKGVCKILYNDYLNCNIQAKYNEALEYSRTKRIILEQFIERKGFLMSGDFIIEQGKIIFMCFGDVHFNNHINGLVPRSISLPASCNKEFFEHVKTDLQNIIDRLDIQTGVFNVDVIKNSDNKPVLIDIGARNGGNLFNDIISMHTGIDLIGLSMKQCVGEKIHFAYNNQILGYFAHNVIHSSESGIFKKVTYSPEIQPLIIYEKLNAKAGDKVYKFINSSFRIGLILLKFNTFEQMHEILSNIHKHVKVELN